MRAAQNGKLTVGIAMIVITGVAAGVWPNLRATKQLDAQIVDLASRVERSDDGEAALLRLATLLEEREASAKKTLKDIPIDGNVGDIIRDMSDEFGRLGLGRPEIRTGRPIEHEKAKALPMTVELSGGFLQIIDAVKWMESIDRLVRVRKLRIDLPSSSGKAPLFGEPLESEITLDVFYDPFTPSPFAATNVANHPGEQE